MGVRQQSLAPALVAGGTAALALSTVILATVTATSFDDAIAGYGLQALILSVDFGLTGVLVLRDTPTNRLGPLFSAMGLWLGLGTLSGLVAAHVTIGSTTQDWLVWVNGMWTPVICGFLAMPLIYPNGQLFSPRWRVPLIVSVTCGGVSTLALAVSAAVMSPKTNPFSHNPLRLPIPASVFDPVAAIGALVVVAIGMAALTGQFWHVRGGSTEERARVGWLIASVTLLVLANPIAIPWLNLVIQCLAMVCLAVGVIRHHLFDIGTVLTRSLVYGMVIVASLAVALALMAVMGSLSGIGALPALAAAVTAVALASAHTRITRTVDRALFGLRQDPSHVLGLLGDRLTSAEDPQDVLPCVVTTLRESLSLPYAAITLTGESQPAASDGERPPTVVSYPLRYGGQDTGFLELGLRRGEATLSGRDAKLVSSLAAQAGTVAHSAQAAREVRRSREQLVTAREEERRAMRRDLHDGLGPALAGMALGLQSMQRSASSDEQAALAGDLLAQARQSLDEVRRMARDLRPAPLDELGLAEALRHHAQMARRMSGGRPDVHVVIHGELPELPAAVEVAAYRITQEAVENSTRHAHAATCWVELSVNGSLVVSVRDDGAGIAPRQYGAGLRSMRERADELGGSCTVAFRPGIGTTVLAQLPLSLHSAEPTRDSSAQASRTALGRQPVGLEVEA